MATFMVPPPWPGQDATAWQGVVSGLTSKCSEFRYKAFPLTSVASDIWEFVQEKSPKHDCMWYRGLRHRFHEGLDRFQWLTIHQPGDQETRLRLPRCLVQIHQAFVLQIVRSTDNMNVLVNLFNSPFYTEVGFKLCQEDTQTDGISFLSIQPKFLVLCAASLGRGPKLGEWPTTIAARGQGLPAWTLSQWGRGILATLMHEEHHILGGGNGTSKWPCHRLPCLCATGHYLFV